jgi:hypothetical protein
MANAGETYALRPLGIGEILDRAVSLYIRNFLALSAIVLVMLLPYAILQFFVLPDQSALIQQDITILQHPGGAGTLPPGAEMSVGRLGLLFLMILVAVIIQPFAITAVAVGVARRYLGRPIDLRACFATALQRWPVILGLIGMEVLTLFGFEVVGIIGFTVLLLIGVAMLQIRILGILVLAIAGLLFLAFFLRLSPSLPSS